jgi:hypothetical protein
MRILMPQYSEKQYSEKDRETNVGLQGLVAPKVAMLDIIYVPFEASQSFN